MVKELTAQTIESSFVQARKWLVPPSIGDAVGPCISSNDYDALCGEYQRLVAEYKRYTKLMVPAKISYQGPLTLDAYSIFYLPRYTLIPIIGLRDLALHYSFQSLPTSLKVLDLGSGTGAIVLGLLAMIEYMHIQGIKLDIVALDSCSEALHRQKAMIAKVASHSGVVRQVHANLDDVKGSISSVSKYGPYDLIFSGSCLTELEWPRISELIGRLPGIMTKDGFVVIAEAQRDYTKKCIQMLAGKAADWGLHVYYPCPVNPHCVTQDFCWVWRDHEYIFPRIVVDGRIVSDLPKDKLTLSWLILTQSKVSIYDDFTRRHKGLTWRPVAEEHSTPVPHRLTRDWVHGVCDGEEVKILEESQSPASRYPRGSLVGLTRDGSVGDKYRM